MDRRSLGGRGRSFDLLLVESQPEGIEPFIDSFRATERTNEVYVVSDGVEALDFVHQRGGYADAPRPDLVLLDLHVPREDGEKVLTELKARPELRRIPVLVFTSSEATEDVAKSYELQANAYLRRPDSGAEFEELAQVIEDFWLKLAQIPPK